MNPDRRRIILIKIAPSLLSADMAQFKKAVELVSDVADYVHCDVMDGHFVPNLTFGAPVVKAIKRVSRLPLDVHLMIENPGRWIEDYMAAGLGENDMLTFHVEAVNDPMAVIEMINNTGIKSGISLKPATPVDEVAKYIKNVDLVLVMTVEPGFGGQSFMVDPLKKVSQLSELAESHQFIAVDGGIDLTTAPDAVAAGANFLVAGAAVFRQDDPVSAIRMLRNAAAHGLSE